MPGDPDRPEGAGKEGLSGVYSAEPDQVRSIYDEWADRYSSDMTSWGYEAPNVAAHILAGLAAAEDLVLDVGCGTGLTGVALRDVGFHDVVGVDASPASLDQAAATGAYRAVAQHDLTRLPLDLVDETFGALICVGVMTYLPDVAATCREFCRLVEKEAPIVLTQRTDLFESRDTRAAFEALVEEGRWRIVDISEPGPYIPGHEEYADDIGVHYCAFQRR